MNKYLFGPVNSRRLGRSLGVDIVPFKTCPLNCVYCECGATTRLTTELSEYVPTEEVIAELDDFLSAGIDLDVVTFSGGGEPTLHSGIGRMISFLKEKYPKYRIAVLTNGVLLWKPEVRRSLEKADIVMPSLDAVGDDAFRRILRPAKGITPGIVVEGIREFRKEFKGSLVIEVFILPGINDTEEELGRIKKACLEINPEKIQLNSLDRPGTESWVVRAGEDRMISIMEHLSPLRVEIIGRSGGKGRHDGNVAEAVEGIKATLLRRPMTIEDLQEYTGYNRKDLERILEELQDQKTVRVENTPTGVFYRLS